MTTDLAIAQARRMARSPDAYGIDQMMEIWRLLSARTAQDAAQALEVLASAVDRKMAGQAYHAEP